MNIRTLLAITSFILLPHTSAWAYLSCPPEAPEDVKTRSELVSYFQKGDIASLEAGMSRLQQEYEAGKRSDISLMHIRRGFYDTDPKWEDTYDKWVAAYPESHMAHIARGFYLRLAGHDKRGGQFVSETPQKQLTAMTAYNRRAWIDFKISEKLTKKPILTYHGYLGVVMLEGSPEKAKEILDVANALQPQNWIVRHKYFATLRTRWGGSLKQMRDFTEETRAAGFPPEQIVCFTNEIGYEKKWLREHNIPFEDDAKQEEKK